MLAVQHLLVWANRRVVWAHLFFSLMALGVATLAWGELLMMHAQTAPDNHRGGVWAHVGSWVFVLATVGFVRSGLKAGRPWLGWAIVALRSLFLAVMFRPGGALNLQVITELRPLRFLGDTVYVAQGPLSRWMALGQFTLLLLVAFVADTTVAVWRRGDRREAVAKGGSIIFFVSVGAAITVASLAGAIPMPVALSPFFVLMLVVMGHEMSREVLSAGRLREKLSETESRYRDLFEGAVEGIFATTPDGRVTLVNPALATMLGYGSPGEALREITDVGRQVWVDPDERDRFWRELDERGVLRDFEARFRRRDGSRLWVSITCRTVRQPGGTTHHAEGFLVDIGPRKEAEREIEERLQFEVLLAELSVRLVNLPAQEVHEEIEGAMGKVCLQLGFDRSMLWLRSSRDPDDLVLTYGWAGPSFPQLEHHPDPLLLAGFDWILEREGVLVANAGASAKRFFPRLLEGARLRKTIVIPDVGQMPPEFETERELLLRFGLRSDILIPLVADDALIGVLTFETLREARAWPEYAVRRLEVIAQGFAGALARSETDRALRESETRLRLAAEAAQFGTYDFDYEAGAGTYSPEFLALYDLPPEAVLELDADSVPVAVHPEDKPIFLAAARACQDPGGDGVFEVEFRVRRAGRERWLRARGRTIFSGEGVARRAVRSNGILQDITDRKSAELETQRSRAELTHLSRVAMLGELSGSLAHELNQPLAAILSNTQAAQRFLATSPPNLEEVREILGDIVEDDQRAGEVIRRLRVLLKRGEVTRLPLNLNEVVQDVLKMIRSDLVNHGVSLTADFAPALPPVVGDRVQVQQVLLNLIVNANEAMASAPSPARRLRVRTEPVGEVAARVCVCDSGTGMPREVADNLFQPFFTTKASGMGIGLKICRTIITSHGGELQGENNPDRGATFSFTLPAAQRWRDGGAEAAP